ncbi:trichothecene 3-O-acetyltransferase [Rhizodiscina lignyota]|uniref:Trichothecene 3-O-acetyltransferase n=1 Tax=Rhizodiscina lignyota TaxID=1504668 RepID=A0A9P4IQE1_9PEZI|nr:trichothecene 3-O-acetyltransferase [Rhizodiscina lignyota]
MDTLREIDLDDFHLDILGQQPRINKLYTQITFCFPFQNESPKSQVQVIHTLTKGLEKLSTNFPWVSGKVVNEDGCFKIKPFENTAGLIIKDLSLDSSILTWDTLQRANFPFSMLDESVVAPCKTLAFSDESTSELPVFLVQANFISGGLLLTLNGQHGSMDMAGLGQVIYLLAKACRGEPFTPSELSTGNMDRKNIIPLLDEHASSIELEHQISKDTPNRGVQPSQPPKFTWAYFLFAADALAALKSLAMETIPSGSFVSTDDVLSAFVWQSVSCARLPRLSTAEALYSTLSRNVDVRRYLSIPPTYPGLVSNATFHTSSIKALVQEPLGSVAANIRSALDPDNLRRRTQALATAISHGNGAKASFAGRGSPELDVRLSSWAKERCYDLDFGLGPGIGKPEAVRRPQFTDGAREGLVYFLPKTLSGEIAVGVCLRDEDLERLKRDKEFVEFGTYVG